MNILQSVLSDGNRATSPHQREPSRERPNVQIVQSLRDQGTQATLRIP